MARTDEIEALRDAGEILQAVARCITENRLDDLPAAADLRSFADHCTGLATDADERTRASEFLPDGGED